MIVGFEYIDCPLVENNLQGKADNLNEGLIECRLGAKTFRGNNVAASGAIGAQG